MKLFKKRLRPIHLLIYAAISISQFSCKDASRPHATGSRPDEDELGKTIQERFLTPGGFTRIPHAEDSFGEYLRNLPLKPYSSPVLYYHGGAKPNRDVYVSVVDLPIGHRDLHQCADAVMRLRAEYLFKNKEYDDIHFNFVSDGKPRYYTEYVRGDYSYNAFWKYMEHIFNYANTASLHDEMVKVDDVRDVQAGDVLIEKKIPYGHAVIVVDVAANAEGEKICLLAQSYMPAQDIQILNNTRQPGFSPWYKLEYGKIYTPEWIFTSDNLRRFKGN